MTFTDTRGRTATVAQDVSTQTTTWTAPDGRTWEEYSPSDNGDDYAISDPNSGYAQFSQNGDGRLNQITDPDGHELLIGYDANSKVDSVTQVTSGTPGPPPPSPGRRPP
jgi:YD repeat-containing protein